MNLGKNINSLLKRYAEVYVPGIGVFKRIHSPAQFDKQNNVFLPPISYVELDYSAQHGFNIVHYIQQQENLGLNQAQQILSETVENLRADLGQFGQVKLDDLGLLISYGASLVFKPLDLSGFDFQPVTNLVAPEIETVVSSLEEAKEEELTNLAVEDDPVVEEDPVVEADHNIEPVGESISDTADDQDETIEVEEETETAHEPAVVKDPVLNETVQETELANDLNDDETEESPLTKEETEVLEPVEAALIAGSNQSVTPEEEITSKKEIGAIASANANSAYAPNIYEEEPRNSNAIWYWMTGIIVLAMVAVAVVYTNPALKDSLFGSTKPVVKTADTLVQQKPIIPADTLSNTQADSLKQVDSLVKRNVADSVKKTAAVPATNAAAKPPVLEANPVIKESIPVAQPRYQVVIGSAKTMASAEQEAQRLRAMGYKTARAVEGKNKKDRKKIILNTYMTNEEAQLAKKSVLNKIKDAWVEKIL
ncbi:SPOR domain-containing protein [Sphingobacterium multivorum]|uniref:HU domain-containing protein n=1 Tax=Sphingobacterium multivorum TaxID=28454 RepID=UPI001919E55A|nr:SPOR domain-containing protein [Sphingobacterium multivorum]QQT64273.1 SPOR domain-containing protein [Sphingobacterium multivorum]